MWKELLLGFTKDNSNIRLNPPATAEDILEVENIFNVSLPKQLKDLLLEFNGDNWFVLSTKQIIDDNLSNREVEGYMPLDCILFIAGNGCGDYLGYSIIEGKIKTDEIIMWDHELDTRVYKANGLKEAIEKYYNDEI